MENAIRSWILAQRRTTLVKKARAGKSYYLYPKRDQRQQLQAIYKVEWKNEIGIAVGVPLDRAPLKWTILL